jgi:hypothetical protein
LSGNACRRLSWRRCNSGAARRALRRASGVGAGCLAAYDDRTHHPKTEGTVNRAHAHHPHHAAKASGRVARVGVCGMAARIAHLDLPTCRGTLR